MSKTIQCSLFPTLWKLFDVKLMCCLVQVIA